MTESAGTTIGGDRNALAKDEEWETLVVMGRRLGVLGDNFGSVKG